MIRPTDTPPVGVGRGEGQTRSSSRADLGISPAAPVRTEALSVAGELVRLLRSEWYGAVPPKLLGQAADEMARLASELEDVDAFLASVDADTEDADGPLSRWGRLTVEHKEWIEAAHYCDRAAAQWRASFQAAEAGLSALKGGLATALATVDAADSTCPINSGRSNADNCPKCGADHTRNCGPNVTALDALQSTVRAALSSEGPPVISSEASSGKDTRDGNKAPTHD